MRVITKKIFNKKNKMSLMEIPKLIDWIKFSFKYLSENVQ